jgi:hypothetical protein
MEIKMNNNQVVIKDRNKRVSSEMKINENAQSNNVPSERMRKRKITRDDKKTPPIADIIAKMKEGQAMYIRFGHSPGNTWNMDETCVTWAIGPVHMYVPADQQRASNIGIPNTKLRITAINKLFGQIMNKYEINNLLNTE